MIVAGVGLDPLAILMLLGGAVVVVATIATVLTLYLRNRRLSAIDETDSSAAGWYQDPLDANVQRYWDGAAWTEHEHSAIPSAPAGSS
ncbi:hypothetical protein SD72_15140 [Leucobacter komagatae]|uniref:DUF2510 domain-containing protein n=2 Tax=Leucobacter komagatae TaxID=55969 RepID=A0A0D0IK86_9MICO|nr:hypothetical protein SD72_15140 [Leucobacter komagatae]